MDNNMKQYFEYKDGELYWKIDKGANAKAGSLASSNAGDGYKKVVLNGKAHKVHHIVYELHHGYRPEQIDHINGNRADNRIENLRPATNQQNQYNAKLRSDNKSGIKGVSWHKTTNKWMVSLRVDGKQKHFGLYFDIDYAKFVADAMRHKYHKEFANNG